MTTPDETPATEPVAETAAVVPAETVPAETAPVPAAAPYAQQPQAYAPAYAAPNPMPNTWMNITAFVTGLLGLAIIPVVFGHMGVSQSNKGKADFKWMGIVGLVLGYVTIVAWIVIIVAWSALFAGAVISTN